MNLWSVNRTYCRDLSFKKIFIVKYTLPLTSLKILPFTLNTCIPSFLALSEEVLEVHLWMFLNCVVMTALMTWINAKHLPLMAIWCWGRARSHAVPVWWIRWMKTRCDVFLNLSCHWMAPAGGIHCFWSHFIKTGKRTARTASESRTNNGMHGFEAQCRIVRAITGNVSFIAQFF